MASDIVAVAIVERDLYGECLAAWTYPILPDGVEPVVLRRAENMLGSLSSSANPADAAGEAYLLANLKERGCIPSSCRQSSQHRTSVCFRFCDLPSVSHFQPGKVWGTAARILRAVRLYWRVYQSPRRLSERVHHGSSWRRVEKRRSKVGRQ